MNTLLFGFVVALSLATQALAAPSFDPKPESVDKTNKTYEGLKNDVQSFITAFDNARESRIPEALLEMSKIINAHGTNVFKQPTIEIFQNAVEDIYLGLLLKYRFDRMFFTFTSDISDWVKENKDVNPEVNQITKMLNDYVFKMTEGTIPRIDE